MHMCRKTASTLFLDKMVVLVKMVLLLLCCVVIKTRLIKGQQKPLLDPDYALRFFFGTKKWTFKLLANPGDTLRFFSGKIATFKASR